MLQHPRMEMMPSASSNSSMGFYNCWEMASDEEFLAALALFDEEPLSFGGQNSTINASEDAIFGSQARSSVNSASITKPLLFPSVVPIPFSPRTQGLVGLEKKASSSNRDANSASSKSSMDIQYNPVTRMFSADAITNNQKEQHGGLLLKARARPAPPDTISPCGLRKSVKIDADELALLNPELEHVTEILSQQHQQQVDCMLQSDDESNNNNGSGTAKSIALSGETRLRINFLTYGRSGDLQVQHYGKSGCIIPDGLSGTHEMYDQPWKFEVSHQPQSDSSSVVLITWKITNLASGSVTCVRETPQQATLREFSGRTICNKVVKMALNNRAQELESSLSTFSDASKRQAAENAVKVLRPKLCTVGLLFFGLLHDSVHKRVDK